MSPATSRRHTASRWRSTLIGVLVALALAAASCGDDGSADPEPLSRADGSSFWDAVATNGTDDGPDDGPEGPDGPDGGGAVEWEPWGSLDRVVLDVPLDHDDPDEGTIELAVVRRPAADADARIGAILVNPGGPGASGIELAAFFGFLFPSELRDRFDLVTWDPRGVGESTQVRCGDGEFMDRYVAANPVPGSPEEEAEVETLMREFAERCEEDSGELLPHLHTEASARDMDLIREALGDEQISYVGFSYGTFLGATYAELFPERVRAFVLDGAYSRSVGLGDKSGGQAVGFEEALLTWFEWCESRRCSFANGGDPATTFDDLMTRIAEEPLATDDRDGREVTIGLAWTGVLASMYTPELWSQLDRALTDARDADDGSGLLTLADFYNERQADGEYATLHYAFAAYNCLDSPIPTSAEEAEIVERVLEDAPRVGPVFVSAPSPCDFWPVPSRGSTDPFSIPDAPPILVIGTTGDPATPYEWSVQLVDELESAALLTVEGEGHTAFGQGNRCVDNAVETFLLDLEMPESDLSCPG